MAIHPNLPGLVVSIRANGEDLPEYDEDGAEADERNPNACVKYIEAISGARFYIDYSFDSKTFPHINSNISVDAHLDCGYGSAQRVDPAYIRSSYRGSLEWAVRDTKNGRTKHAMMFSELLVSEDAAPDKSLIGTLAALGTIKVEVYKVDLQPDKVRKGPKHEGGKGRGQYKARHSAARLEEEPTLLVPDGRISEKLLKGRALTHQATVGPAIPIPSSSGFKSTRIGPPLAVFLFKYRSRGALQALHLIPRSPSPVLLENRPIEELSMDDMRELIRRQRVNGNTRVETKVKGEFKREREISANESDGDDVEVVEHHSKRKRTTGRRASSVSVVDLCDDE
ncbi:hypothetical protein LTR01_001868 [Friedmanniomyces endolithicus]|nr:hypothetical protein LTR01_001868 [Friedmanniomyces endolithicus]KAK0830401.1 hypothetical protein LTR73_003680 [Friedmanniomyces endolithicus]